MNAQSNRYRRFVAADVREHGERVELRGAREALPALWVDVREYRLARLFDGTRTTAAIVAEAAQTLELRLRASQLEAFAAKLAIHGLLAPGIVDPLPSPSIIEPDTEREGAHADRGPMLPSTVPGSLVGPGLMDGLLGVTLDHRARRRRLITHLDPGLWILFGGRLNWPLESGATLCLFGFVAFLAIFGVAHRAEHAADSLLALVSPWRALSLVAISFALIELFGTASRAAAVRRFTGTVPKIGVMRNMLGIPLLHVDTGGAAERAQRAQRLRIVGAGLTSMAALAIGAVFVWFLAGRTHLLLASFSIGVAAVATFTLLLRLNPLVRRDGYFLLAQHYGIADLREQAGAAWFEFFRRSMISQQRRLEPSTLLTYWALIIAYLFLVLFLLSRTVGLVLDYFRGPAFVILLVVMGVIVSQTFRNSREGSNLDLGQVPGKPWYVRWAAVMVAAACFAIIPYRYDPSGDFTVLPGDRADVRALIAGDVREVRVKEGDVVSAGQVIAKLADDEERAQVAIAEAKLAQAQADLALAKKGGKAEEVAVAESAVQTAKQKADVSAQQAARIADAYKHNSVTAQDYERARGVADVDQKALDEAKSRLALVRSSADAERIDALAAQVQQAQASLAYAKQQLDYTEIKAPIAGRVVSDKLMFARGSYLDRGAELATIEQVDQRVAEIDLPESSVDQIADGRTAWAKVWAYPDRSFSGQVRSIAPSAEKTPSGMIVRVQVVLSDPDGKLLPGMTGSAKVMGHWYPAVVPFTRALVRFVLVEVWSWLP
ncbi:HlyD family secretion protein [Solimonas marina]|uniref:HlyD family efflux transporter periplasmic adaptor subunit n=1 Tax=Solimonas marina TaxID=2714601 RepID=A0A969W675_9GAMM|nr:efflux RND transporter periplasmic adaptor subunit [Solimonas marina]NKF21401.1 HlyD family efflux transporter periplasmic adaptor subunit [Solimonas marina]